MLEEPIIIKINDRDYKVSGFTKHITDSFERLMQQHYQHLIVKNKSILSQDDYLTLLEKHVWDIEHEGYSWHSPKWNQFIQVRPNLVELLHWCINSPQNPITKQEIDLWIDAHTDEAAILFERLDNATKKN